MNDLALFAAFSEGLLFRKLSFKNRADLDICVFRRSGGTWLGLGFPETGAGVVRVSREGWSQNCQEGGKEVEGKEAEWKETLGSGDLVPRWLDLPRTQD